VSGNAHPLVDYHIEFGCSRSNGIGVRMGTQKIGSAGAPSLGSEYADL